MADRAWTLRIDIISDVMCPWCIIGYRQLARALEAGGVDHEIHWQPFELNPDMAAEGQNLREHLAQKYGVSTSQSEQNRQQMTAVGAQLGFDFQFKEDMRIHNSFLAHQLLHWADLLGQKHELKQALFAAYFSEQRDVSNPKVLSEIAGEVGLDQQEALSVLSDQKYAADVRDAQKFWLEQGIQGVPAMVFDRQHLVTGAQGTDTYTRILDQLAQLRD